MSLIAKLFPREEKFYRLIEQLAAIAGVSSRYLRTMIETANDVSLGEMLRIMDVARTLRQERETAQQQFHREEARALLRQRLKASTEITGSPVTDEEIDAAMESYFNNLHTYRDPPMGLEVLFARLYVSRVPIMTLLAAVCIGGAVAWFVMWGLP